MGQWPLGQTSRRPRHRGRGPERPSPRMPSDMASTPPLPDLVLYSRPGCHLCDEAKAVRPGPARGSRGAEPAARPIRELDITTTPTSNGRCSKRSRSSSWASTGCPSRRRRPGSGASSRTTSTWSRRERRQPHDRRRVRGGPAELPLAVRAAARAGVSRAAHRGRGRGTSARRATESLARAPTRVRLRPGLRGRVHAAWRHRDVRGGGPLPVPPDAPRHRRRRPRRSRAEPRGADHDPRLAQSWRPLDAGAAGSVASTTGTMSFASAGTATAGGGPTFGDRLGGRLVSSRGGWLASFGLGAIFAVGWTPCIGIILGGILGLASQSRLLPRVESCWSPTRWGSASRSC